MSGRSSGLDLGQRFPDYFVRHGEIPDLLRVVIQMPYRSLPERLAPGKLLPKGLLPANNGFFSGRAYDDESSCRSKILRYQWSLSNRLEGAGCIPGRNVQEVPVRLTS